MKLYLTTLLLLAIMKMKQAHATNTNKTCLKDSGNCIQQAISIPATNYENFKVKGSRVVKRNVFNLSSVVQDWNLVCRELCGAGLGGPKCGPHCKDAFNLRTINNNIKLSSQDKNLLNQNEQIICPILCELGFGNPKCICQNAIENYSKNKKLKQDTICSIFCDNNNITLKGCSFSSKDNISSNYYEKLKSFNVLSKNDEITFKKNDTKSTTTTTTAATATINDTTLKQKFTTPDWSEICKILCKTGDGGALCNCDLPPFF